MSELVSRLLRGGQVEIVETFLFLCFRINGYIWD